MSQSPRLLALFIAIDDYKYVPDLGGCVKDINKVKQYFEGNLPAHLSMESRTLFNKEATKVNMVQAFEEFLIASAGPDDIALMYYSGHGAQEHGDEVWRKEEPDLGLEGLVCHDTGIRKGTTLLGDKEIRYLIAKLAKKGCDIITVFDSCHSGDASRSQLKARSPRLTNALPKRDWKDFIFSHEISKQDIEERGWSNVVPQGRHIQLAACEDRELAYENERGGVFTDGLLRVLSETGGNVSYFDLQSRVKFAIKGAAGGITQTPQAHVAFGHERDIFRNFLSKEGDGQANYGNISFNAARKQWVFDRGEIHGVEASTDEQESLVAVPVKGKKTIYGKVSKVESGYSFIEFVDPNAVSPNNTYRGFVKGLLTSAIHIGFSGVTETINALKEYALEEEDYLRQQNVFFVDKESEADYMIRGVEIEGVDSDSTTNYLILTYPGDDRPLSLQEKGMRSKASLDTLIKGDLGSLAKWEFVKSLRNTKAAALPDSSLTLTITQEGDTLAVNKEVVSIDAHAEGESNSAFSRKASSAFGVSIQNTHNAPLYIACIYMGGYQVASNDAQHPSPHVFALKPGILQPVVQRLEPGATTYLFQGNDIPFQMDSHIFHFNWPYQEVGFKLIASTDSFDAQMFDMNGLEAPVFPWPDRTISKGLMFEPKNRTLMGNSWNAWNFWVRVNNPYFKED